jgi:hypothetical protein
MKQSNELHGFEELMPLSESDQRRGGKKGGLRRVKEAIIAGHWCGLSILRWEPVLNPAVFQGRQY